MVPEINPTGNQVTGAEDEQQFHAFLQDEIKKAVEAQQQKVNGQTPNPALATTPTTAPITLTVNGQTATFQDQTQLNQFFNQYQQQMQAQVTAAQQTPQTQGQQVTGNENDYTVDQFVETVTKDPKKAIKDALKANGVDLDDFINLKKQFGEQQSVLAVGQFKEAFPDFPGTPQAANLLNQLREQYSLPWDARGLALAYAAGEKQHLFDQFRPPQAPGRPAAQEYQPYGHVQSPGFFPGMQSPGPIQAPPRVSRSSYEPGEDYVRMAEQMSTGQIEELFEKLNSR